MVQDDPSGPLERYMQILELLAAFPDSLSLGEVSVLLKLPKTSAHRLLKGLARSGLVKGGGNRPYDLGERLTRLLHATVDDGWIITLAMPYLRRLTEECGETCYLTRLTGARIKVVASISPDARWRGYVQPGIEMPVNASASGKAIMAYQPPEIIDVAVAGELPLLTSLTRNDPGWLRAHLAEVRQNGFGTCVGEIDEGLAALAVPIFQEDGSVLHSVSMTGPLGRIMNDDLAGRIALLKSYSNELSGPLSIGASIQRRRSENTN